jgi:hypothetical protein
MRRWRNLRGKDGGGRGVRGGNWETSRGLSGVILRCKVLMNFVMACFYPSWDPRME